LWGALTPYATLSDCLLNKVELLISAVSDRHRVKPEPPVHQGRVGAPEIVVEASSPRTLAYGLNAPPAGLAAWIVEKYRLRWQEMPRGGHFAALEEPELLAQEVRAFFCQFR